MNIKKYWSLKAVCAGGLILILVIFMIGLLGGLRLNTTTSLPQGLYRVNGEAATRGDLVSFCLAPENLYSKLAKHRDYLAPGVCLSGLRPLLKHLVGLPGDAVSVSEFGIAVNGRLLPGTVRPTHDRHGRELPESLLKDGNIPVGMALVLASEHFGSFDSRHFGLVPLDSLKKVRPLLTNAQIFFGQTPVEFGERHRP